MQLGRQSDKMRADYFKRQKTEPARRPAGLPASAAVTPEPQAQPQPVPQPQAQPAPQAAEAEPKAATPRPRPRRSPHKPRARPPPHRRHGRAWRPSRRRGVVTPPPWPRPSSLSPRPRPTRRPPPLPSPHESREDLCNVRTEARTAPPPDRPARQPRADGRRPAPLRHAGPRAQHLDRAGAEQRDRDGGARLQSHRRRAARPAGSARPAMTWSGQAGSQISRIVSR